eukprot:m.42043 g.42043  ORF g.42043 m.42043 type:complete len:801 (+) comp16946_c0_seq2:53-2455(+)
MWPPVVCVCVLALAPLVLSQPCDDNTVFVKDPDWPAAARAILNMFCLFYAFIGVGILSDKFMEAIETITSKDSQVEFEGRTLVVKTWNATIANLSLMALGSSAPEILLAIIEVVSRGFIAGELGPSTIVGSAAFNLLVIVSVCVFVIPAHDHRKIAELPVFGLTAGASVFAYLWLLFILLGTSPDVIEIWEAVLTLLFFPALLILAYMADKRLLSCVAVRRASRMIYPASHITQVESIEDGHIMHLHKLQPQDTAKILRETMQQQQIRTDPAGAWQRAASKALQGRSNIAIHRIDALRWLTKRKPIIPPLDLPPGQAPPENYVGFASPYYEIMENQSPVTLTVVRTGDLAQPASVNYRTEGITATPDEDYVSISGTINFAAHEWQKTIEVEIIDDDEVEPDETFCVILENVQPATWELPDRLKKSIVCIIDDDKPGEITFAENKYEILENAGQIEITVLRKNGSSGTARVHYYTSDGAAVAPHDYIATVGELVFRDGEVTKTITIPIVDDLEYEKDEDFRVTLCKCEGATLGAHPICTVIILNDDEMTKLLDKVTHALNLNTHKYRLAASNWHEQLADCFEIPEGIWAQIIHWFVFPWNFLAALIPPTTMMDGWPCFVLAISLIGFVTAFVGDFATLLGCAIGLKDSITAITFVALGTSLPDTFASKLAAVNDETADASLGNVTGSNSVNVFLGLGLPWTIASIYWSIQGSTSFWREEVGAEFVRRFPNGGVFVVPAGDLGFSVGIFSICACVCIAVLLLRRKFYGAELGGPRRVETAALFCFLWFLYVLLSSLKAYQHF